MLAEKNLLNLLRINPLFVGLNEEQLACLVPLAKEFTFQKGELVIKEGESPDMFYIIRSGSVEVIKKSPSGKHSFAIRSFGVGEVIGEIGLLAVRNRAASVKAATNVDLIGFSIEDFNTKENLALRHVVSQNLSLIEVERLGFAYDVTIDAMRNELMTYKKVVFYQLMVVFLIVLITYYSWYHLFWF